LLSSATRPWTVRLLAWNSWSIVRVVAYVMLGAACATPLATRLGYPGDPAEVRLLLQLGGIGVALDLVLKLVLSRPCGRMLGLAVDPGYPARPYLYLFYAHNVDENGVGPRWFDPDDPLNPNDICPTPPGATTDGCVIYGRLSRVVVDTMTMTGVEEPLLDSNWCQQFPSHSTGDLVFGDDGMLYASAGEGANFFSADFGQSGSSTGEAGVPINPCGDPPDGVGEFPAPPNVVTGEGELCVPRIS